jgi:hypothetical protein
VEKRRLVRVRRVSVKQSRFRRSAAAVYTGRSGEETAMARQPRDPEPAADDPLEAAARRLERAIALLETRMDKVQAEVRQSAGSLFDFDRSKLADELDTARARERELAEAGREASQALGRAIAELRGAVSTAKA